jgi:hypothetical protein
MVETFVRVYSLLRAAILVTHRRTLTRYGRKFIPM